MNDDQMYEAAEREMDLIRTAAERECSSLRAALADSQAMHAEALKELNKASRWVFERDSVRASLAEAGVSLADGQRSDLWVWAVRDLSTWARVRIATREEVAKLHEDSFNGIVPAQPGRNQVLNLEPLE